MGGLLVPLSISLLPFAAGRPPERWEPGPHPGGRQKVHGQPPAPPCQAQGPQGPLWDNTRPAQICWETLNPEP